MVCREHWQAAEVGFVPQVTRLGPGARSQRFCHMTGSAGRSGVNHLGHAVPWFLPYFFLFLVAWRLLLGLNNVVAVLGKAFEYIQNMKSNYRDEFTVPIFTSVVSLYTGMLQNQLSHFVRVEGLSAGRSLLLWQCEKSASLEVLLFLKEDMEIQTYVCRHMGLCCSIIIT